MDEQTAAEIGQAAGESAGGVFSDVMVFWFWSGVVFAVICALLATAKGRSAAAAGVLGFFFGVFALIGYLIAGDSVELRVKKEEEARAKYRASKKSK